ncbi:MAG: octaprenyl diphosphate synthase [Solirubrobacterales bacterium]|nr:octaprenyl diphosphate synthase [Solirubrobacterales bacterium]
MTQVLDAAQAWLPRGMAEVERRLTELVGGHGEPLGGEATATLAAGGKRLRPMLVLLCAGEAPSEGSVRAATAVELVHMATLVHDDVLDDAPLRRGRPTVFARAGRPAATAVGDLLLSRAFAELATPAPDDRRRVGLLAAASVALARGELAQRRDAYENSISAERYLERCRLKTARLFECACLIGGEPDAAQSETLAGFGREIGLAFQLLDDVLDVAGPPERTGKARGTDLLDGTVTMPLILARERDRSLGALDLRGLDPAAAEEICERIAATGALDWVRADARARVEAAKAALRSAALDDQRRALLTMVADGVVERYS